MASDNTLTDLVPKILARGLLALRERCIMPRLVNFDYSAQAAERGDTIDVPIPTAVAAIEVSPSVTKPSTGDISLVDKKVSISLDQWYQNTPIHLSDKELVEIDRNKHFLPMQFSEAIRGIANVVNASIFAKYLGIWGAIGTAGTTPFSDVTSATNARKLLNKQLCYRDSRRGVLDADAEAAALALSQFSDAEKIGSSGVKIQGEIGRKYGIDWFYDDAVPSHTAGTVGGTSGDPTKVTAEEAVGQTTINIDVGVTNGCALKEGDIITFGTDTQQYVLTADATISAAATGDIIVAPPLKTIVLINAEVNEAISDHVVNLAFHRDAFAFATRPLISETIGLSLGSQIMSMQDPVSGLVLRLEVSRQHKRVTWEFDILWGAKLVRPELACRLAG